jgi:hypothetical protein
VTASGKRSGRARISSSSSAHKAVMSGDSRDGSPPKVARLYLRFFSSSSLRPVSRSSPRRASDRPPR